MALVLRRADDRLRVDARAGQAGAGNLACAVVAGRIAADAVDAEADAHSPGGAPVAEILEGHRVEPHVARFAVPLEGVLVKARAHRTYARGHALTPHRTLAPQGVVVFVVLASSSKSVQRDCHLQSTMTTSGP